MHLTRCETLSEDVRPKLDSQYLHHSYESVIHANGHGIYATGQHDGAWLCRRRRKSNHTATDTQQPHKASDTPWVDNSVPVLHDAAEPGHGVESQPTQQALLGCDREHFVSSHVSPAVAVVFASGGCPRAEGSYHPGSALAIVGGSFFGSTKIISA